MILANIIPEYLEPSPQALQVYIFCLRRIQSKSIEVLINNKVVSLKPYELVVKIEDITRSTGIREDEIEEQISLLTKLKRIEYHQEGAYDKIKILNVVIPDELLRNDGGNAMEKSETLFVDFADEYLKYVETNLSNKSLANAKRVMKHFKKHFEGKKLSEIAPESIERYKHIREEKGVKRTTINMDIRSLKAAIQVAVDMNYLPSNPIKGVKNMFVDPMRARPITKEEFSQLLNIIEEPWLYWIILFAVSTGLRRGEILNLKWKDVDQNLHTITIQSCEEYRVKNGKTRVLPLNVYAQEILRSVKNETEYVFVNSSGERYSEDYVSKKFKKYIRQLGLHDELHFHSLRATFASWAADDDMSTYHIQEYLGHASMKTTQKYLRPALEALRRSVEKISFLPSMTLQKDEKLLTLITSEKTSNNSTPNTSPNSFSEADGTGS